MRVCLKAGTREDVMKWTFIHPDVFKGAWILLEMHLFVGMRMNSEEKIGQEERKKRAGGGRRGSEVRPINKQLIDFLPLSAIPGETPRLHHPVILISTYVKDTPRWGKPAALSPAHPLLPG